jgi:hypothetical protein
MFLIKRATYGKAINIRMFKAYFSLTNNVKHAQEMQEKAPACVPSC